VGRISNASLYADLLKPIASDVVEEKVGRGVVGHERIEETIAVVVGKRDAHALAEVISNAGFFRHVSKSPIAIVAIERVVQGSVLLGMTVAAHSALHGAVRVFVRLPLAVIHDEQVKQPVVVVVEPTGGNRPHLLAV